MTALTRRFGRSSPTPAGGVAPRTAGGRRMRRFTAVSGVTLLGVIVASAFLFPLVFMTSTAFKEKAQLTTPGAPMYPAQPDKYSWQGAEYPVYDVPLPDGTTRSLAGTATSCWITAIESSTTCTSVASAGARQPYPIAPASERK